MQHATHQQIPTNSAKLKPILTELPTPSNQLQIKPILLIGNYDKNELASVLLAGYKYILIPAKDFLKNSRLLVGKSLSGIIIKQDFSSNISKSVNLIKKRNFQLNTPILFYTCADADTKEIRTKGVIDEIITDIFDRDSLQFKLIFLAKVKKLFLQKFRLPDKINSVKSKIGYSGKRIFDIVMSSILLILFSPIFILVSLAIKLESKGPILYTANRAGRYYKIFPCFKFRTMIVNADKMLENIAHLNQYQAGDSKTTFIKIKNDPRITRIGNFLRNTSLDELPQLINVLLGHMSLVGNRPLPLYEATNLTDDYNSNRFCASAGLTGLWQVMKRGEQDMSVEERIDLDIQYAQNASPLVDFWILLRTPLAMVQKADV